MGVVVVTWVSDRSIDELSIVWVGRQGRYSALLRSCVLYYPNDFWGRKGGFGVKHTFACSVLATLSPGRAVSTLPESGAGGLPS